MRNTPAKLEVNKGRGLRKKRIHDEESNARSDNGSWEVVVDRSRPDLNFLTLIVMLHC